jgi:hypothetical protein
MLMSPVGLRSEKGCTGDARQKLKSTDPTARQRGHPTSTNPKLSKNNQRENGKNWSRVLDGCLTPGRTGRLTVGRNVTLTLTLTKLSPVSEYVHRSPASCRRGRKWSAVPRRHSSG